MVPTPDPNLSPRDRLAALLAKWKNTPAPATISQEDLHRNVGTLRIVINHIDQLYIEIQNLRAEASATPNIDIETLTAQLEELQQENTNLQANATRLR
jgi:hypothetical protein